VEPEKPALSSKSGSEKKSGPWRPTKRQVLWVIGMVVALLTTALLIVNLRPEIWKVLLEERNLTLIAISVSLTAIIVLLAIGGATSSWTGFRGKTVWDLLQLLIVPLALAVIGLWFAAQQDARQQQTENQRAEAERELAAQRAQDEALQTYLNQMSNLLLEKDLHNSEEDSEVRTLARARTLTVLGRLNGERNATVVQFLREAKLIGEKDPVVRLDTSYLHGANLSIVHLGNVDLSHANLRRADLRRAVLSGANLSNADLTDVHVSEGQLLTARSLHGATMPNGQKYEDWLKSKSRNENGKNEGSS
jgi:flagellar basal body-associated protein FliL